MDKRFNERQPDAAEQEEISIGWKMAGLGMEAGLQALAGALLGWLYDRWRGTGTTGTLIGALIGIAVGMWSLIKGSFKINKKLDAIAKIRPRRQNMPSAETPPPLPDDDEIEKALRAGDDSDESHHES
ncbi:MAG TPA: AtpZ/AtpI family protein [Phycisphaerales bacterium]|nr:AtpZ/AtpI family protein [Phycisphaerales bacterium]